MLNLNLGTITANVSFEGVKNGVAAVASNSYSLLASVGLIAKNCFKLYSLYSLYESALSDILCLKTFRHGTNPYAAARIALTGPDLDRAGKEGEAAYVKTIVGRESCYAGRDQGRKAFYFVEDYDSQNKRSSFIYNYITTKFTAKYYSLRSTATFLSSLLPMSKERKGTFARDMVTEIESSSINTILALAFPTVKFHYHPDQVEAFTVASIKGLLLDIELDDETPENAEAKAIIKGKIFGDGNDFEFDNVAIDLLRKNGKLNKEKKLLIYDENAYNGAMYTKDQFSVTDMGFTGIVKNGVSKDMFSRMYHNKAQFVWGVAQLVAAVAFTAIFFPVITPWSGYIVSVIDSAEALGNLNVAAKVVQWMACIGLEAHVAMHL